MVLSGSSFISRIWTPGTVSHSYVIKNPPKQELYSQSHVYFMMHKISFSSLLRYTWRSWNTMYVIQDFACQYLKEELLHNMYIIVKLFFTRRTFFRNKHLIHNIRLMCINTCSFHKRHRTRNLLFLFNCLF